MDDREVVGYRSFRREFLVDCGVGIVIVLASGGGVLVCIVEIGVCEEGLELVWSRRWCHPRLAAATM